MFKVRPRPPASTECARLPFVSRPKTGPRVFLPDGIPQPESGDSEDNGRGRVGLLPCTEGITRVMIDGAGHAFDGQGGPLFRGSPAMVPSPCQGLIRAISAAGQGTLRVGLRRTRKKVYVEKHVQIMEFVPGPRRHVTWGQRGDVVVTDVIVKEDLRVR